MKRPVPMQSDSLLRWLRLGGLLACCAPTLLWALAPGDFSTHRLLEVSGQGPWYRLDLPFAERQAAQFTDLRDLRIYDAQGEFMPFSLVHPAIERDETAQRVELKSFPLYDKLSQAQGPQPGVRLEITPQGTLLEVAPTENPPVAASVRRGWLLDASKHEGAFSRLGLDWTPAAGGDGFQRFSLDTGDDLQHWRRLGTRQVVRLSFEGQQIEQSEVDLSGADGRYLRLLWQAPAQAPVLNRVWLVTTRTRLKLAPLTWSAPMQALRAGEGEYDLRLSHALPLEKMRVALPQPNTLAPLEVSGATQDRNGRPHWEMLARGILYRLPAEGGEALLNELRLPAREFQDYRLRVSPQGGGLDSKTLTVEVGIAPQQVVFLARGEAPYRLAVGSSEAPRVDLSIDNLMPMINGQRPNAGLAMIVPGQSVPPVVAEKLPSAELLSVDWKRWVLWGVLCIGVGVLAFMTLRILRKPE